MTLFILMLVIAVVVIILVRIGYGGGRKGTDEEVFAEIAPYVQADAARRWAAFTPEEQAEALAAIAEREKAEKIAQFEAIYRERGAGHMAPLLAMLEYDRQENL